MVTEDYTPKHRWTYSPDIERLTCPDTPYVPRHALYDPLVQRELDTLPPYPRGHRSW